MSFIWSIDFSRQPYTYIVVAQSKDEVLTLLIDKFLTHEFSFYCNDRESLDDDMEYLKSVIETSSCFPLVGLQESRILFEVEQN